MTCRIRLKKINNYDVVKNTFEKIILLLRQIMKIVKIGLEIREIPLRLLQRMIKN